MSKLVVLILMVALSFFGSSAPLQAKVFRHSAGRAEVPTLDAEAACRDVAKMDQTTNYSSCIADERKARTQLENEWVNFSATDREQCIYLTTSSQVLSYISLQNCLQTRRDAEKLMKSSPGGRTIGNSSE
jgi:hypothetical protein